MAIARLRPDAVSPVVPNLPRAQPAEFKSTVVENILQPVKSLLAYAEGAPWTVNYYSQLLGKNNDLKDYDPGQPELYQQYLKIHHVELRVTAPLSSSYINETGVSQVQGSAYLPSCITPNVGDVFLTSVDNGDDALFRVTLVERKSHNRESLYYIEYSLYGLIPQHPEWLELIEQKVQREYYFHKDRLIDGLDALVTPHQHERISQAEQRLRDIVTYYFKTFFNRLYSTLVLPNQSTTFYDPLLVRYLLRMVDSNTTPEIIHLNNLSIEDDAYLSQPTLWDAMLEQDYGQLEYINRQMGFVTSRAFFRMPSLATARYQRMNYILYPLDADTSVTLGIDPLPKEAIEEDLVAAPSHHGLADMLYNEYIYENTTIRLLPSLFEENYYVLSPAFYTGTGTKSLLEVLVLRYLKHEALDLQQLLVLLKNYTQWNRLEQFYFLPLVIAMLKTTLGGVRP